MELLISLILLLLYLSQKVEGGGWRVDFRLKEKKRKKREKVQYV
jgi:hypothetical protein